jgi:hypothetical protein
MAHFGVENGDPAPWKMVVGGDGDFVHVASLSRINDKSPSVALCRESDHDGFTDLGAGLLAGRELERG